MSYPSEAWLPVNGWGLYEASSLGSIRNVKTGQVLKPFPVVSRQNKIYWRVTLYRTTDAGSERQNLLVHGIVADVWCEKPPLWEVNWHVDHRDADSANNAADNLRWVLPRHNIWLRDHAGDGSALPAEIVYEEAPF